MRTDQGIGISLYLCSEIIVSSALDMVRRSQQEKCGLKYVIYIYRRPMRTVGNNDLSILPESEWSINKAESQ